MGLQKLLEETPEAYYWMGFLMADGCFTLGKTPGRYQVRLMLAIKDEEQVKRFAKYIDANYNIVNNFIKSTNKSYKAIASTKRDCINLPKIIKKFNINKRKTYNPPENLLIENDDLFLAFLIGYFDGDGGITENQGIVVSSHISWQNVLVSWFSRLRLLANDNLIQKSSIDKEGYLHISCKSFTSLIFIKDKIKELNLPILERKWNRIVLETFLKKRERFIARKIKLERI